MPNDRTTFPNLSPRPLLAGLVALGLLGTGGCQMLDGPPKGKRPEAGSADRQGTVKPRPRIQTDEQVTGVDLYSRGTVLADQGLLQEALGQFEQAIAENPLYVPAYMGAGSAHYRLGNLDAAEENFDQAAKLEPRNFDAQFMHGVVLQELQRLDEAIRAYLRALGLRPDDFRANGNLGAAYLQAGEPGEGLPYSQRAVELNPNDGAARTNLGATYAALGEFENAITEYQQAAELTELSPELLLNLAESYGRVQRYDEMVSTLEQVVRLKPTAVAYERMGSGYFRLREYDLALGAFQEATKLDDRHFPAFNGVGVCLLQQYLSSEQNDTRSREDALRALRRSLQIEPKQPKVLELVSRYR